MKKAFLLLSFVALSISSCSSDDSSSNQSALQGKWQHTKTGFIDNNEEVLYNYDHAAGCTKDYIELKSDNTSKSHIFETDQCIEYITTGTYSNTANTIKLSFPDQDAITAEIVELSETTLKIKYQSDFATELEVFTRID